MKDNPRDFEANPILKYSFEFSLLVVAYCRQLTLQRDFAIANQFIRCGTAIGANMWEAQSPESKADFCPQMQNSRERSGRIGILDFDLPNRSRFPARRGPFGKNYRDQAHPGSYHQYRQEKTPNLLSSFL